MSTFAETLLEPVKLAIRETGSNFDTEIQTKIAACARDLQTAGMAAKFFKDPDVTSPVDPLVQLAVELYVKSAFGLYNDDSEKYDKAYQSLKADMCTKSFYTKEE